MPSKYYLRNFQQGGFYHIYNRGAYKNNIFLNPIDYEVYLSILSYYLTYPQGKPFYYSSTLKFPKLEVRNLKDNTFDLMAYCLMPNHFHFLIHQKQEPTLENSITNLMRRLSVSYAMYTKDKHGRSGALLQGRYKTVEVTSDPQLLHLSRYIHLNPTKLLAKNQKLSDYSYSSYPVYIGKETTPWLNPHEILSEFTFSPTQKYLSFVENQTSDPTLISHLTLD